MHYLKNGALSLQIINNQAQKKLPRSQQHKIEDHAISMLSTYGWPGNVRQLRHFVERLVATASDGGSELPDQGVVSCVVRGFGNLSFPQPEGGIVTVVYPIIFNPGD